MAVQQLGAAPSGAADTATRGYVDALRPKRVLSLSNATSVSVSCDSYDMVVDTGITGAITLNNPTGTPAEGFTLWYALTGTAARAITYGTRTRPRSGRPRP